MIKTSNCCFCCRLEAAGYIIGWISLISYVGSMLGFLTVTVIICTKNCEEIENMYKNQHRSITDSGLENCGTYRGILIAVFIVCILIFAGFAAMALCLIRGTSARDHIRVRPMMIWLAICAALSLLQIFRSFTAEKALIGVLITLFHGYLFVVLYSLYDMFKVEYERGFSAQYQAPGRNV